MTPEDERVLRDLASTPKFQAHYRRNDNLWLEGKKRDRPPLNCADADEANRMKIQVLRRHGSAIPAAMRLANVLECRPYAINAASPVFMRAFQRHLTQHLHVACERIGGSLSIVSAVHPRARVPIDGLHPDIFQGLERHLHRALHAAGIEYAVGGFDLSANEHESGDFKPHYQAQAWVLAKTSEVRGGERVLRSWFPTSDTVFRPVRIEDWDGYPSAIAYAVKPDFDRRVTRLAGNTTIRDLRVSYKVEMALAMYRAGPMARLFLHNIPLDVVL